VNYDNGFGQEEITPKRLLIESEYAKFSIFAAQEAGTWGRVLMWYSK
jgi:hypothetical protein